MNARKRHEIFARLKQANPSPTTELQYRNPFELLVSVILSAQATDKSVNKATAELFKVARTPRQILDLGLRGLKRYIKTIGLYNTKAANIRKTCKILLEKHGGQVPATREELQACRAWDQNRQRFSIPPSVSRPSPWIRISCG
jgi:endonuclease-3